MWEDGYVKGDDLVAQGKSAECTNLGQANKVDVLSVWLVNVMRAVSGALRRGREVVQARTADPPQGQGPAVLPPRAHCPACQGVVGGRDAWDAHR